MKFLKKLLNDTGTYQLNPYLTELTNTVFVVIRALIAFEIKMKHCYSKLAIKIPIH